MSFGFSHNNSLQYRSNDSPTPSSNLYRRSDVTIRDIYAMYQSESFEYSKHMTFIMGTTPPVLFVIDKEITNNFIIPLLTLQPAQSNK